MLARLNLATHTRYLVAEIVVVLFVAVSFGVAYRIDPQWISRHVTLLNLWPPRNADAWSICARSSLVLLPALVVIGLRLVLLLVASKGFLARLMRWMVPALLAIAASAVIAEALVGWMWAQVLEGLPVYMKRPSPRRSWRCSLRVPP